MIPKNRKSHSRKDLFKAPCINFVLRAVAQNNPIWVHYRLRSSNPTRQCARESRSWFLPPLAPFIHPEVQSCAPKKAFHAREASKPLVSISVPRNRPTSAVSDSTARRAGQPSGPAPAGVCSRAAFRNSRADPRNSATKNPLNIKISPTELYGAWCIPPISAITATSA